MNYLTTDQMARLLRNSNFFYEVKEIMEDALEVEFSPEREDIFEDEILDVIHQNGWHVAFRDHLPDGNVQVLLSADRGVLIKGPIPPLLYHIAPIGRVDDINNHGLRLGVGSRRHEITYSPRIFLTDAPLGTWGVHFDKNELIVIVGIKTWLLSTDIEFYRDPQHPDDGWGSCYVSEPLPRYAIEFSEPLTTDQLSKWWHHIPEIRVPRIVKAKYNFHLGRQSPTPLRTSFFNVVGSLPITDKLLYKRGWSRTPWGEKIERFIVEGAEKYTPDEHPWREGPVEFRYF